MAPAKRPRLSLAVVALVGFFLSLDFLVVVVALPSIQRELHFSPASIQWVVTAYGLVFGGFLLLTGRMGDVVGHRRMLVLGIALFAVGSLLGGLAPIHAVLVAARAVQGLAEAFVAPAVLALVAFIVPDPAARSRAVGLTSGLASAGVIAGTVLGGLVTESLGWRWLLLLNVTLAAVALVLVLAVVPESRDPSAPRRLDVAGAVTVTAGLAALLYAVSQASARGPAHPQTVLPGIAALGLLATFVAIEVRAPAPLVRFDIVRRPTIAGANVGSFSSSAGYAAVTFLTTVFLEQVLGYSPLDTSLALLPFACAIVLGSPLAGRLAAARGVRAVAPAGLALTAAGMALLSQAPADASYAAHVLPGTILAGLGAPLGYVPATSAAFEGVGGAERGIAGGIYETSAQVGGAVAVAVVAAVAAAGGSGGSGDFELAFLVAATALLAGAAVVARLLRSDRPHRAHAGESRARA